MYKRLTSLDCDALQALEREIWDFPRRESFACDCGATVEHSTLDTYVTCAACARQFKRSSYGSGPEPQDVILLVLKWLADDPANVERLRQESENPERWREWYGDAGRPS